MVQFKEFQGKTLDDAIREACEYFGVEREKLEIDIVSDAKTGIFGLVGVKKAIIRAGRVELYSAVDALLNHGKQPSPQSKKRAAGDDGQAPYQADDAPASSASAPSALPAGPEKKKKPQRREAPPRQQGEAAKTHAAPAKDGRKPQEKRQPQHHSRGKEKSPGGEPKEFRATGKADNIQRPALAAAERGAAPEPDDGFQEIIREDMPEFDLASCDRDLLFTRVQEVVQRLVEPIVGDVPCEVIISGSRVRATLDCGDAAGLLVGRDGQTLAAVQSLASRIIARQVGGALRLQIDAGKYRERQDDKLKEQALSLASRVKETGRALSTRPLTAYQRRIVHLALEHDESVQTYSRGEGAQRKVVIAIKRDGGKDALSGMDEPEDASSRPAGTTGSGQKKGGKYKGECRQSRHEPADSVAGAEDHAERPEEADGAVSRS